MIMIDETKRTKWKTRTDTEYYKVHIDVRKQSNDVQQSKQCSDCVITGYKIRRIKNELP